MQRTSSHSVRIFSPRYSKAEVLERIRSGLEKLREKLPLRFVALFGSYASGRHTASSDIDVLIVYEGEYREDAYVLCKKLLVVPRLEPHVYSAKEYDQVKDSIQKMLEYSEVLFTNDVPDH
jgi:predicted nucleotidyltransferase